MILYANVDDLALIINEVLPKNLFEKVSSYNYENIKNKKRHVSHEDWQETLHKDNYKVKTMEQVKTINSVAEYDNQKYQYVDKIFKDVPILLLFQTPSFFACSSSNCCFLVSSANLSTPSFISLLTLVSFKDCICFSN